MPHQITPQCRDALLKIRETLLRVYKLCPRERESDIMASIDEIDAMLHPLTWASCCAPPVNAHKETLQ